MAHTNTLILLTIISLLSFYLYISKIYLLENKIENIEPFSILDFLKKKNNDNKTVKSKQHLKYPNYIKDHSFIIFKDDTKLTLDNDILSHNEYEKATLNDEIILDLDSILIPLISKINKTLGVSFNKNNIDYRKVVIKIDKKQNALYQILLVLFQKKGAQQELKIEIYKSNTNKININDIKEVASIHTLALLNNNNDVDDYYHSDFGNEINDATHEENKTHFDTNINKNIDKISKFYNLESIYKYPTIDDKLHDFNIADKKALSGYKHKILQYGTIDFKINPNGIQERSGKYNSWFIDRQKEKQITKVYPQNKVSSTWDHTGTLISKQSNEKDGVDYAYEERNKIPRYHISQYSHYGNNNFNRLHAFKQFNT
jgi:hypothetical protein